MYNDYGGRHMKLEKSLKISRTVIKILKGATIVNAVVLIALFFFSINEGFREFASTSSTLTLGSFKIIFNQGMEIINVNNLTYACLTLMALYIIWFLILRQVEKIINNALNSSIFCKETTHSLNLIGIYIIINGLVNLLVEFLSIQTSLDFISNIELFNPALVSNVSIDAKFDISFVAIAFVIFILAKVFAYGQELQELSDETL